MRARKPPFTIFAFAAALMAATVLACSPQNAADELRQADALARTAIEAVRTGGVAGVQPHLAPETARAPELGPEIDKMRDALPRSSPDTVQLVASEIDFQGDRTLTRLRYRVRGQDRSAEAEVWVENRGGSRAVETLRISGLP